MEGVISHSTHRSAHTQGGGDFRGYVHQGARNLGSHLKILSTTDRTHLESRKRLNKLINREGKWRVNLERLAQAYSTGVIAI